MRDTLRSDEGLVPEGYTLTELLLLARSSLPNHRAAAMRMLADVLRRARPSRATLGAAAAVVPLPPSHPPAALLDHSSQPAPQGQQQAGTSAGARPAAAPAVHWHQVWQYAVHDLAVAPHVRLALDDDHAAVVAAAAAALAALLCPADADAAEEEAADCCSSTGA